MLFFISCNGSNTASDPLTFYYYPQKNVYFDPSSKKYFYSLDGGQSWDSLGARSENPAALGPRVIVTSAIRDIWKNNLDHRKEFNASVINIPPGDSLQVTERRVTKRSTVAPPEKKEKRNFLQRLFGKKKSD